MSTAGLETGWRLSAICTPSCIGKGALYAESRSPRGLRRRTARAFGNRGDEAIFGGQHYAAIDLTKSARAAAHVIVRAAKPLP